MNELKKLFGVLRAKNKSPGSDYTGTVTKVEGSTAYVQLTGSEITDTPVSMSIDCKPGDRVRVRVSNGRAWITGNDTQPPSNDKKEVATKMSKDMSDRDKHIIIRDGIIKFIANTLGVDSKNFKLDENGNAEFSGLIKGATYVDSTANFNMDIGSTQGSAGAVSPAFKFGGYINGDPSNDYLEVQITLLPKGTGEDLPHLMIAGMIKDSPEDTDSYGVSIQVNNGGIDFYGSFVYNSRPYRVVTSLPWTYSPPKIDRGYIAGQAVAGNSYKDYSVYFGQPFTAAPTVTATLVSNSTAAGIGSCTCTVHSVTKEECKIRVFNADSASKGPAINWIAIQ